MFGQCGLKFWLTEGSALGAIRDGRIIPTDTDIDIGVLDCKTLEECALPKLRARGFRVWHRSDQFPYLTLIRGLLYIDVMVFVRGGDCMDIPCDDYEMYMRNMQNVDLYGMRMWSMGEEYLERVYGDWRTPRHQWKP